MTLVVIIRYKAKLLDNELTGTWQEDNECGSFELRCTKGFYNSRFRRLLDRQISLINAKLARWAKGLQL